VVVIWIGTPKSFLGEDLYRITALGEIIRSASFVQIAKKNLKLLYNIPMALREKKAAAVQPIFAVNCCTAKTYLLFAATSTHGKDYLHGKV
jgi:hypothetical protein